MGFLDRTKRTFDLSLGSSRCSRAVLAGRQVRLPFNRERLHHILEHARFSDRTIVEIDHLWSALEWIIRVGLYRHGIEQKTQCCFCILAVDAVVLLVSSTTAVIDHAEDRQCRLALTGVDPVWLVDAFEIGRRNIELPAIVAVFCLKTNRSRFPRQAHMIQVPTIQIAIDGRLGQQPLGGLY
ncbi:hypothetical protein D9M71_680000 [compost metagenome]